MDAQDGQVPAPRRPALPRLRRTSQPIAPTSLPFVVPGEEHAPRVPDLSDLLADIDALRLTLQTDLTLAAAALEAGAESLAGELVDSDLSEVRAFGVRAADRLSRLEQAGDATADVQADDLDELAEVAPLRRRRILSAAPLMAAAAALIGFVAFVPERGAQPPETRMTNAAMAGYELSRLAQSGASDEQLRLAAEELNDELAELIAQAKDDPAAAQQALLLLETTTAVLSRQGDSGVLASVMAETRALRQRLRDTLPAPVARTARQVRTTTRTVTTAVPRIVEQPEKERSSSPAPKATASPAPSSSPTPAPAAPSPAPSASPAPAEPSPEPSESSGGPILTPGDLPGW